MLNTAAAFFIGFPTFEKFLISAPKKKIYLSQSNVITKGGMMQVHSDFSVTAATVCEDGVCHYWKMDVGAYSHIEELESDREIKYRNECRSRAEQIEKQLTEIARGYEFNVINALISFPKNMIVLRGRVLSLGYDRETNTYKRIEAAPDEMETLTETTKEPVTV